MIDLSIPSSAVHSLGVVMQTTANNIANVNTDGYKAEIARLESGPLDRGVQVGAIYRDLTPGPAIVYNLSERDVRSAQDVAAQGMRNSQENYDTAAAQDVTRIQQEDAAASWRAREIRAGQDANAMMPKSYIVEASNTDLPREFANLAMTENAYSAVAATIRTMEHLTGSLLNVMA